MYLQLMTCALAILAADDAKDVRELQGKWHLIATENNGKAFARNAINPNDYYTFEEKTYAFASGKRGLAGSYNIYPDKSPKQIDKWMEGGPLFKGIYELDGDRLRIYFGKPDGDRPTEFKTKEGEDLWLQTFERVK